tara:strand:+ start:79 stop:906 length:828 start_codon:yes stop_codon:yes gene_type:complete
MKIGVGIITCDRPEFFTKCRDSIKDDTFDHIVVVNDGFNDVINPRSEVIKTNGREGVGKGKNKALKYLSDKECDYYFLFEDDMIVLDSSVFKKYIEAHKISGIHHFNYGPGSPFNRKQTIKNFDLHNRHELDQHSEPNPKLIIDYKDTKISLYEHTVAMFSFYTKEILDKVGYIDEDYYNAWEHVDHTYNIIKAGYHPPFWYFADLYNSHKLLTEAPQAIDKSSIAGDSEQWKKNVYGGREIYLKKHGHYPNEPPFTSKEEVLRIVKELKNKYGT